MYTKRGKMGMEKIIGTVDSYSRKAVTVKDIETGERKTFILTKRFHLLRKAESLGEVLCFSYHAEELQSAVSVGDASFE